MIRTGVRLKNSLLLLSIGAALLGTQLQAAEATAPAKKKVHSSHGW